MGTQGLEAGVAICRLKTAPIFSDKNPDLPTTGNDIFKSRILEIVTAKRPHFTLPKLPYGLINKQKEALNTFFYYICARLCPETKQVCHVLYRPTGNYTHIAFKIQLQV